MKFTAVAVALLAALVEAKPSFTNSAYNVVSGQPFTLTWTGAVGPVTILLKTGPTSDLQTITTIDSDDSGTTFTWTPPSSLVSGTYAFEISDSSGVNYSPQFTYSGNPTGTLGLTATSGVTVTSGTSTATVTTSGATTTTSGSVTSKSSTASSSITSSPTSTSTSSSPSSSSTKAPTNTNDGQRFSSPLAFILVAVAALVYFN